MPSHPNQPQLFCPMLLRIVRPRTKHSITLALILICLGLFYFGTSATAPPLESPIQPFKLNQKRREYKNGIYDTWNEVSKSNPTLDSTCDNYLKALLSRRPRRELPDFEKVLSTKFPLLLYQKRKWIAEEKKHYRRRLKSQGIRLDERHTEELEQLYYQRLQQLSFFEEGFIEDMNHLRVFGKCLMDSQCSILNGEMTSSKIVAQLFPWLLGQMPSVNRKLATPSPKNIIAQVRDSLKGRGIVIPLLPGREKSVQILNTKSLIYILRAIGNDLPIDIVYVGEKYLNEESSTSILEAGKGEVNIALDSRNEYLQVNSLDKALLEMPSQLIRFVNVKPTIIDSVDINDNLLLVLSSIFNSFDEMMLISPTTIPVKKNLVDLFENVMYKEHGTLFFKHKALLDFKPQRAPPGAFDAKDLIKNYAGVNDLDKQFFGLEEPQFFDTMRIRDKGYTRLIDPSLMVINKSKTLSGLLISSSLPFYGVLGAAFDFSHEFNPELMWFGQELSGSVKMVNFNPEYAVAAGILTPPENIPAEIASQELCSSSWAQLGDDGHELVYVTSHQLENRVLPAFVSEIHDKYTVKPSNEDKKGNPVTHPKIDHNILAVQSVLVPVEFEEAQFNLKGLQTMSWKHLDTFGLARDFWCAYDVVGDAELQNRGTIIDYGNLVTSWYMFLLDTWVEVAK